MSTRALRSLAENAVVQKFRLGAYRALASGLATASQVLAKPDWAKEALRARTVQSPILDVRPKSGTPLAIVSQDGAAAFPLAMGQIFEEGAAEAMTAWVRADLENTPDEIQVGAEGQTLLGTDSAKSGVATKSLVTEATSAARIEIDSVVGTLVSAGSSPTPITAATLLPLAQAVQALANALVDSGAYSSSVLSSE